MKKILLLLSVLFLLSCQNDDGNNDSQNFDYTCCDENPFAATNVDNLDQSLGEIIVVPYATPNNDLYHDQWGFINLIHYPNNHITIYNNEDEIIFQASAFQSDGYGFPPSNIVPPDGVYKYKLVVENEDIFLEYGYFCLITDGTTELSTALCDPQDFDPIIGFN